MTAIERANELQAEAIAILLAEREKIDAHLAQLGYGDKKSPVPFKKRGRPKKDIEITPQADSFSIPAQP